MNISIEFSWLKDKVQWQALVLAMLNLSVPHKAENFFTG
jgi:hypothetical protein